MALTLRTVLLTAAVSASLATAGPAATNKGVRKILFLGNSITLHGPSPRIGWSGNWGMAASAKEKDFVHLVTSRLGKIMGIAPEAKVLSIARFERQYGTYDVDGSLKDAFEFGADLVIVAIGENVRKLKSEDAKAQFKAGVMKLLRGLKKGEHPTIVVRSCFWPNATKDQILKQACAEVGGVFVDIGNLGKDERNYARSEREFKHKGVAAHPGDRGMQAIADAILAVVVKQEAAAPRGREYVVAPNGDDAAEGSRDAPFRTIQRAASVMRAGDTCLVRAGDYSETVVPTASGVEGAPITFKAWPGEKATIWGTDTVRGWQPVEGGVHRAPMAWDLGKNNQVFVEGKMANEARWPNVADDDLLTHEGAKITKGSPDFIQCDQLPDGLPDDHWRGAVIWVIAGAKWTSWTTVLDSYDATTKTLRFTISKQGSIAKNMSPGHRRGGYFYLVGTRGALDGPNEWFYDATEKMLYLRAPGDADPNTLHVTAKRRRFAFNLAKRSHIHVSGFDIVGATVNMDSCDHCVISNVRARYISHTRGGRTGYGLNERTGIRVGGRRNVIRDSEIAHSAGSGVHLAGTRNAVVNCWIHHMDYMGSYDCPVKTWGAAHLISHNTIHDTGRDCIQPLGQAHVIEYNDISNMGRICHDLGATYVCGSDGGGTEFRYNWCHDNRADGTRMGIYLDNFTSNYFVHHNVCWAIKGRAIHLNKPSLYNVVAHNTILGRAGNWGRWKTDWMYGCVYASNVLTGRIQSHPQPALTANVQEVPEDVLNKENFRTAGVCVDRGIVVPGITGQYRGKAPDAGAYEQGLPIWKAGHDFTNPPRPVYRLTDTPLRNRVRHGSFAWLEYRSKLGPWRRTHARAAKIVRGPGGIVKSYTTRDTIIGAGVCLQSDKADGIEQTVEGLAPNTEYDLAAWLKVGDASEIRLGVRGHGGEPLFTARKSREWDQARVRFTTGAKVTAAVVFVSKVGSGKAYADDIGLVQVLPGFPLGKPGMAPVPKTPETKRRTRAVPPFRVRRVAKAPPIDGTVSPAEYPKAAISMKETPGRLQARGKPCTARLAHDGSNLYVAVTVPLSQPLTPTAKPAWTKSDGAEVCLRLRGKTPILVLHGFPNGACESVTEAGAPKGAAAALGGAACYAAGVGIEWWTAEWRIPFAAAGIEYRPKLTLDFNLGVRRVATKEWIVWAGTRSQNWRLDEAGAIVFE